MQITNNLRFIAPRTQRESHFLDLIDAADTDFKPRNFADRRLVDEMATSTWRALRAAIMERAVYDHQDSTFESPRTASGDWAEPNDEARFNRQFHGALRLLLAFRNGSPPPSPDQSGLSPLASNSSAVPTQNRKESTPCNASPLL